MLVTRQLNMLTRELLQTISPSRRLTDQRLGTSWNQTRDVPSHTENVYNLSKSNFNGSLLMQVVMQAPIISAFIANPHRSMRA